MAQLPVTKEVLDSLSDTLTEKASILKRCAGEIDDLFPEQQGFEISGGPPLNDAIPSLTEFVAIVHSRIEEARHARLFGPSAKANRMDRYKEKREKK